MYARRAAIPRRLLLLLLLENPPGTSSGPRPRRARSRGDRPWRRRASSHSADAEKASLEASPGASRYSAPPREEHQPGRRPTRKRPRTSPAARPDRRPNPPCAAARARGSCPRPSGSVPVRSGRRRRRGCRFDPEPGAATRVHAAASAASSERRRVRDGARDANRRARTRSVGSPAAPRAVPGTAVPAGAVRRRFVGSSAAARVRRARTRTRTRRADASARSAFAAAAANARPPPRRSPRARGRGGGPREVVRGANDESVLLLRGMGIRRRRPEGSSVRGATIAGPPASRLRRRGGASGAAFAVSTAPPPPQNAALVEPVRERRASRARLARTVRGPRFAPRVAAAGRRVRRVPQASRGVAMKRVPSLGEMARGRPSARAAVPAAATSCPRRGARARGGGGRGRRARARAGARRRPRRAARRRGRARGAGGPRPTRREPRAPPRRTRASSHAAWNARVARRTNAAERCAPDARGGGGEGAGAEGGQRGRGAMGSRDARVPSRGEREPLGRSRVGRTSASARTRSAAAASERYPRRRAPRHRATATATPADAPRARRGREPLIVALTEKRATRI